MCAVCRLKNQVEMYVVHLSWTLSRVANCLLFNGTNQTWWRSRTQTKGTKNQAHQKAMTEIRKENRGRPTTCWRNQAGQTKELLIVPYPPDRRLTELTTEQGWINRCPDVTSTHVSSTVTFRPTWNVYCDTIPLWHFNLLSCFNPLTTSRGFFIHLILFGWIVTCDITSTPFTWNVTFDLLWQFVHPWKYLV